MAGVILSSKFEVALEREIRRLLLGGLKELFQQAYFDINKNNDVVFVLDEGKYSDFPKLRINMGDIYDLFGPMDLIQFVEREAKKQQKDLAEAKRKGEL